MDEKGQGKQVVWRCVKGLDHGATYCPNSPSIDENSIHEALIEAIFQGKCIETDKIYVLERALEKVKKFTKERTLEENRQELQGLSDQLNELHEKMRDYQEHQEHLFYRLNKP